MTILRRLSHAYLCALPFIDVAVVAPRALRIPHLYQTLGAILFALAGLAAWNVGLRSAFSRDGSRSLAVGGGLLIAPWTLVALLWVGLATPWDATTSENVMRYEVLLVASIAVTGGLLLLSQALADDGEKLYSTLGSTAALLAGATYVVWTGIQLGLRMVELRTSHLSSSLGEMNDVFDVLLFAGCVLTYLATACVAISCRTMGWIGRVGGGVCIALSLLAVVLLGLRGLSFPDPSVGATPWYANAGFIVGIPAIPWIIPHLLGVIMLRRAGELRSRRLGESDRSAADRK